MHAVVLMMLVLSISVSGLGIDLQDLSQKKQKTEELYNSYQEKKKDLKKRAKKFKQKLKEKLHLTGTSYDREALYWYVEDLATRCEQGSLEAINEACEFFEIDNVSMLQEGFTQMFVGLLSPKADLVKFELCGTYIGDDGLEYDDGETIDSLAEGSFYSLPIHYWEKKVIEKIVTAMAEKSLAQLLLDRKEMEKRGDQINHVHPLRFIAYVMSDGYLKSCMNQFKGNSFKWSNFINGYAERMKEEAACDNLNRHIEGFCDFLKVDPMPIYDWINKGNYEGLVLYLLQL